MTDQAHQDSVSLIDRSREDGGRIESLGAVRLLACLAVICIHTSPFSNGEYGNLGLIIDQASRFAVPFFFVTSGYLWMRKRLTSQDNGRTYSKRMGKRVLLLFLVWSLIYLLPYDLSTISEYGAGGPVKIAYWRLDSLLHSPIRLALAISQVVMLASNRYALLALAVLLYGAGLLCGPYRDTALGFTWSFNPRNGPFFSTIFFVFGIFLAHLNRHPRQWLVAGLVLLIGGYCLQILEFHLHTPAQLDFMLGTIPVGIGAAMVGLSNHWSLRNRVMDALSRYTLGIYVIQYIFIDNLEPLRQYVDATAWQVLYPLLVFILAIAASQLIGKQPQLRRLVA